MKATVDQLLNDAEINYLADLFLAHLRADKATRGYRLLRNAVILYSHGAWQIDRVYSLIAACADISELEAKSEIARTINGLETPPHEAFNRVYAPPDIPYDNRPIKITMPEELDPNQTIEFLGVVFSYLIVTNYPKYEYLEN